MFQVAAAILENFDGCPERTPAFVPQRGITLWMFVVGAVIYGDRMDPAREFVAEQDLIIETARQILAGKHPLPIDLGIVEQAFEIMHGNHAMAAADRTTKRRWIPVAFLPGSKYIVAEVADGFQVYARSSQDLETLT